jgi:nucleotide-binding universal stress UspA family protein
LSQDYVTSPAGGGALYPEEVLERDREGAAQYLKNVQARLRHDHPTLVVAIAVLAGPVAETIIDYAREQGVELIVMSSHGRSGLSRWVYGSVADKVLRGADCPTLIIRGQPAA